MQRTLRGKKRLRKLIDEDDDIDTIVITPATVEPKIIKMHEKTNVMLGELKMDHYVRVDQLEKQHFKWFLELIFRTADTRNKSSTSADAHLAPRAVFTLEDLSVTDWTENHFLCELEPQIDSMRERCGSNDFTIGKTLPLRPVITTCHMCGKRTVCAYWIEDSSNSQRFSIGSDCCSIVLIRAKELWTRMNKCIREGYKWAPYKFVLEFQAIQSVIDQIKLLEL
jgi:hypothetical protein